MRIYCSRGVVPIYARRVKWIVLSLLLQFLLLFILETAVLNQKTGRVTLSKHSESGGLAKNTSIAVPESDGEVSFSFKGSYFAYIKDGALHIKGLDGKSKGTLSDSQGGRISFFRWFPDRNMVIYSSERSLKGNPSIQVSTFDVDAGVERSYPPMEGISRGTSVADIRLSVLTRMAYVRLKSPGMVHRVYRYNIVDELEYVADLAPRVPMEPLNLRDGLVCQLPGELAVIAPGEKKRVIACEGKDIVLLGVDSEDRIYLGELDKGKVLFVERISSWDKGSGERERYELPKAADVENIGVTREGGIWLFDPDSGSFSCLNEKREYKIKGEPIQAADTFLVYKHRGMLTVEFFTGDAGKGPWPEAL